MKTDAADRIAAASIIDAAITKLQAARSAILTGDANDAEAAIAGASERVSAAAGTIVGIVDAVWCAENPEALADLDAAFHR